MAEKKYARRVSWGKSPLWPERPPALNWLDIELTERCNNDCVHCCINLPVDDPLARKKELSTLAIKEILREAAALGCLTVRFTGGEPLLREDFEELYLFSRRLGLKVVLFTNGTLITTRLADLFTRVIPIEKIEISLYGMKKDSYEAVTRIPGSFAAAWRGVRLLMEKHVPFQVKSALLPPNEKEHDEFLAWSAKIPWMNTAPQIAMLFDLRCRRDSEAKNRLIRELRLSPHDWLDFLATGTNAYIEEMQRFCSTQLAPWGEMLFLCGAGLTSAAVDAYGFLQACLLVRHPDAVYDLRRGSLAEAMKSFFPDLRQKKSEDPEYEQRCAACFLRGLCVQCPGKAWIEHGTLDTPVEYLCEVTQVQARFLELLAEGEKPWEIEDWRQRIEHFAGRDPGEWQGKRPARKKS